MAIRFSRGLLVGLVLLVIFGNWLFQYEVFRPYEVVKTLQAQDPLRDLQLQFEGLASELEDLETRSVEPEEPPIFVSDAALLEIRRSIMRTGSVAVVGSCDVAGVLSLLGATVRPLPPNPFFEGKDVIVNETYPMEHPIVVFGNERLKTGACPPAATALLAQNLRQGLEVSGSIDFKAHGVVLIDVATFMEPDLPISSLPEDYTSYLKHWGRTRRGITNNTLINSRLKRLLQDVGFGALAANRSVRVALFRDSLLTSKYDRLADITIIADTLESLTEYDIRWVYDLEVFQPSDLEPQLFIMTAAHNDPTLQKLQYNQFPPNCRERKFMCSHTWGSGLGSWSYCTQMGIEGSYITNRTYILADRFDIYADITWCRHQTPQCYFESYTNCTLADVAHVFEHVMKAGPIDWKLYGFIQGIVAKPTNRTPDLFDDQIVFIPGNAVSLIAETSKRYANNPVEVQYRDWGLSSTWDPSNGFGDETGHFVRMVLRQRRWLREELEMRWRQIPELAANEYVAMHIRRGDKVHPKTGEMRGSLVNGTAPPPTKKMRQAQVLREKHSIRHLFLATDDQIAIKQVQEYPEFIVLYQNISRHNGSVAVTSMFTEEALKDRVEITITTLLELKILSESAYFVGSEASQMSNLAIRLMEQKKRHPPLSRQRLIPEPRPLGPPYHWML